MVKLLREKAVVTLIQEWTFLMIMIIFLVATLVQEWTLAVHAKAHGDAGGDTVSSTVLW